MGGMEECFSVMAGGVMVNDVRKWQYRNIDFSAEEIRLLYKAHKVETMNNGLFQPVIIKIQLLTKNAS
jgi:hypothetical protein